MSARFVGMRVSTPKGPGEIRKIMPEVRWVGGDRVREDLIVVQLDGHEPTGMRPVFYASQIQPIEEASSRAENQAEALEVERHQERKHGAG